MFTEYGCWKEGEWTVAHIPLRLPMLSLLFVKGRIVRFFPQRIGQLAQSRSVLLEHAGETLHEVRPLKTTESSAAF